MKKSIFAALAAIGVAAGAIAHADTSILTGSPGDEQVFDRIVNIKADAKWANVISGENVKFVDAASGKSLVWQFDKNGPVVVDLAAVAPRGSLGRDRLVVYVTQNPLYYTGD